MLLFDVLKTYSASESFHFIDYGLLPSNFNDYLYGVPHKIFFSLFGSPLYFTESVKSYPVNLI